MTRTAPVCTALALLSSLACSGIGSRPAAETDAAANGEGQPITIAACVVKTDERVRLRVVSQEAAMPQATPTSGSTSGSAASADANSGYTSATGTTAPPSPDGMSASANGAWIGSRDYLAAGTANTDWSTLDGQLVTVTGTVHAPPDVRSEGTDQMQARRGAVLAEFRATSVTPLNEPCGNPTGGSAEAREPMRGGATDQGHADVQDDRSPSKGPDPRGPQQRPQPRQDGPAHGGDRQARPAR